jgi:hypothetical protein
MDGHLHAKQFGNLSRLEIIHQQHFGGTPRAHNSASPCFKAELYIEAPPSAAPSEMSRWRQEPGWRLALYRHRW